MSKSADAIATLKYTTRNGVIYSRRISTKRKLAPQNTPNKITRNQSLFFIISYSTVMVRQRVAVRCFIKEV
jgi:hypothetical protein